MYTIAFFIIINFALFIVGFPTRNSFVTIDGKLPRNYTDCLRGLAMILIIFGHICGRYHESVWFSPFACTGVALFLLLSGYGNNESFYARKVFPISKILKIAIPYLLFYFVLVLLKSGRIDHTNIVHNITFIKTDYWFVGYLFKWYFIYWLVVNYLYKYRWIVFILFSLFSFAFLSPLESEQSLSFIAGVFLSEHKESILSTKNKSLFHSALILFVLATTALAIKQLPIIRNNDIALRFVQLLIKLPYAWCIIVFLRFISWLRLNPVLVSIAPITYELYLVHMALLDLIDKSSTARVMISTTLFIVLSIVLALVFKKINQLYINRL